MTDQPREDRPLPPEVQDWIVRRMEEMRGHYYSPTSIKNGLEAAVRMGMAYGRREMKEEAVTAALEERCERDTPWDLAVMEVVKALRSLED